MLALVRGRMDSLGPPALVTKVTRGEELEFRVAPRSAGDDEVAAYFEVIDQSGRVLANKFNVAVIAGRIGGSVGENRYVPELFGLHLT